MGPCQGRLCGTAAAALLGCSPAAYSHRPVAVPVPLTALLSGTLLSGTLLSGTLEES
jgi:hypothetical protein